MLINTVTVAYDKFPEDAGFENISRLMNIAFSAILLIEFILKVLASGFKWYFKDYYNIFDFILVILAILDIVTSFVFDESEKITSILRAIQIFRIVKIAKLSQ